MKDWRSKNKMPEYAKKRGKLKFKPENGLGLGISKLGKLVAKNANRSLKKGVRQEAKRQIRRELNK